MPTRGRAAVRIAAIVAWAVAVSLLVLLAVYPRIRDPWTATLAQLGAYVVIVVPVLLLRPRMPLPIGRSRWSALLAAVLIAAAVVFAAAQHPGVDAGARHAVRAVSAGVGEELVFRGAVFALLEQVVPGRVVRTLIDAALFAAFHVPLTIVQGGSPAGLAVTFVVGVVLSVLRRASGGLLLPAAAHVALDLTS